MVFMPFEVTAEDAARVVGERNDVPTMAEQPPTELAADERPALDDRRPWFGLHNVVHELVAAGCYVCEEPYSDEAEAAGCPGDPTGRSTESLRLPEPRIPLGGVGRNDPCPCGSGAKFKRCHGAR
jgi:hypothetical protein